MEGADRKAKGTSDLGVRTASALVMVAVAGAALWLGGLWWAVFVGLLALGVFGEFRRLACAFATDVAGRVLWSVAGVVYIGLAAATLALLREGELGHWRVLSVLAIVIGTDVGAYFAGRTFGGPKIAPAISPSKTWSGLVGGMIGASALAMLSAMGRHFEAVWIVEQTPACQYALPSALCGLEPSLATSLQGTAWLAAIAAIVAQIGDFFESWMKRRAGVKDSGKLIPGHGGLFDRVDGLLAVLFVIGLLAMYKTYA